MANPFYTIGHSTRSMDVFVHMLRLVDIALVVDIRTIPKSRSNPHYNSDTLEHHLAEHNIEYQHIAALGGLRKKSKQIPPIVNGFWQNQSFHNYADYALTDAFQAGLQQLISLGELKISTIMCAESVWWRCHRRIVADHLLARGKQVFHLMAEDKVEPAQLTQGSQVNAENIVTYPQ